MIIVLSTSLDMIGSGIVKSTWILFVIAIELSDCYVISPEETNQSLNSITSNPTRDQLSLSSSKVSKNQQQTTATGSDPTNNNTLSIEDSTAAQAELELYWLNRRDNFFQATTFNLTKVSNA